MSGRGDGGLVRPPPVDPARYHVVRELARGGLGRILEVRDLRIGRVVALKEILHERGGAYARFVREAAITARLEHPAIVPVHDIGRWPSGEPFYSMKLVSGRTLHDVIHDARSLAGRLALLPNVIAVADAIAYAHNQGIIHRDLKPANVLVGAFGETIVIDWGLAKELRGDGGDADAGAAATPTPRAPASRRSPSRARVMGTPRYMPPEQARGEPVGRAHRRLRARRAALRGARRRAAVRERPRAARRGARRAARARRGAGADDPARPGGDRAQGHGARPEDRYPSARELAEDLRRFQTGRLVSVHAYSRGTLVRRWLRRYRAPVASNT